MIKTGTVINKRPQKTQKHESTIKSKSNDDLGMSELNMENNKSSYFGQTLPRKGHQIDNYEGPIDPITRLRHGYGTYRYPNKFFTFTGNYKQGVKSGQGALSFADGTLIKGMFQNDQLMGEAQIKYADGSTYKGNLVKGQKSGRGHYSSKLQQYEGQYLQNRRHGKGTYKNATTTITGQFQDNKPHGDDITITKYNYQYQGSCSNGLKHRRGVETSAYVDDSYRYEGQFRNDKFDGEGQYVNNGRIGYRYQGAFEEGLPKLYPNQFKLLVATGTGLEPQKPAPQAFVNVTTQQTIGASIQYQLQSENQLYLAIQCCYQAPQQLDPNQPTEEQIDKMVKYWQNQNKKNKNPPPMPDFSQPRMIKPALVLVQQQSMRPIQIFLAKLDGNQTGHLMKVDYRDKIKHKREENQKIKAENAKKAEQQGNKKGGKAPNKNQVELKVNCFVEIPTQNQKHLQIKNEKGKAEVQKLQFPDDFPPGNYQIIIKSPFKHFRQIKQLKKNLTVKSKNAGGKKK